LKGYDEHDDMMDRQDYVAWQRECLAEMIRVLRNDGVIFYNHKWRAQGGKLEDQAEIVNGHALPVRQIIIWKRSGGINTNPGYFLPTYEVIYVIAGPDFKLAAAGYQYNDVWEITQERDNPHPAPFPLELPLRCIESIGDGIILDPFIGSGTTAIAAIEMGRPWVGIEKSQKYCDAARERIGLAVSPTKALPQPEREPRRVEIYSESEPAWVTPPEYFAELDKEFHFTKGFDPCPYPRPEGFDGLKVSWPQSTYCNAPFRKKDSKDGQGIAAFARKAIEENKLGKDVVLVLPTKSTINFLLEAGAEFRSARRIPWIDPKTGQPATTSPSSNMLAILRGKPVVPKNLPRCNPEEIADLLVSTDPEKAGEVWRALGERLASSMTVFWLAWHGIPIPDNPILFPARAPEVVSG
jgi:site-specific DNA-methyltransferase (adenine-specific)